MHLLYLGTALVVPEAQRDTASVLLNHRHLVDTGWAAPLQMVKYGEDPLALETVFITHCHHDHFMAVPQVLFYLAMRASAREGAPPLRLVGPRSDIGMVADRARHFLQADRFPEAAHKPEVIGLRPGESWETEDLVVDTAPTIHPVAGLCYRFTDRASGRRVVMTGDTGYFEPLARFAGGCDLLIHEASLGGTRSDPLVPHGHSGSLDAAHIARAAGVARLDLVHYRERDAEAALAAAREVFPETYLAREGDTLPSG
jgi:ribonuclease Z